MHKYLLIVICLMANITQAQRLRLHCQMINITQQFNIRNTITDTCKNAIANTQIPTTDVYVFANWRSPEISVTTKDIPFTYTLNIQKFHDNYNFQQIESIAKPEFDISISKRNLQRYRYLLLVTGKYFTLYKISQLKNHLILFGNWVDKC